MGIIIIPIYLLLAPPWAFFSLALLSVATGLACARWMPGVSRKFGLLTAGTVWVVLGPLMLSRRYVLDWMEAGFGGDLTGFGFFLTLAIYVAAIIAIWGVCRLRRQKQAQ